MKATTPHVNFARAKLDHDLQARNDLPIYQSGADEFENWISNFKGNAIYRTGWEAMVAFEDCAFVEFKFSNNQNYILVLYNTKMRFLSYDANGLFGWVESAPSTPLEVTTPWSLAESKEIARSKKAVTQNFDTMIITHKDHEPRKLTRVSATSFTLLKYARKDDPFPLTWAASKAITGASQAANANLTIVAHGYSVGDRIKISGITGMTQLNAWTATVLTVPGVDNVTIDVDTRTFTAYSANGIAEKVSTGDYPATCLFAKGRLSYGGTRLRTTTMFQSESGFYYIHTLPASVTDASALQYTIAEIAQPIEWMVQGSNSLIVGAADGIVAINGGGVGEPITSATIEATITPADGCGSAEPLKKDGNIFYIGQNGRNVYYFKYDVLTEEFLADDANVASYDISAGGFSKIRYTKDKNNLVHALRGDGDWCTMNFSEELNVIGWHEHSSEGTISDLAQISDNDGNPQIFGLFLRNSVYYIERQAAYVEFRQRAKFHTEPTGRTQAERNTAKALDDAAYNRYVAEQLKGCIHLDNSTVFSDLRDSTITYDAAAGTITDGDSGFVSGDVGKHIVYKTATGYESGRFLITGYNAADEVDVEVLQTPLGATTTLIPQIDGTAIGDMTDGGGLASAFDTTTSKIYDNCARKPGVESGYVGKDWGSGVEKTVTQYKIWGASNTGYDATGSILSQTVTLKGSDDGITWVDLHTDTFQDNNTTNPKVYSANIDTSTAYRYHAVFLSSSNRAVLAQVEFYDNSADTYSSWYLTFDTLTGLSRFNNIEVSVVADGGYLGDYEASGGEIDLGRQVTHAVVGYKYRGIVKSFPLGFQIKEANTQTTMKAISRAGVRAATSVGGKFGTSPYKLEPVQELSQNDLNYLPPLPIDGTKYVGYVDDNELDKHFYLVQDEPGPFTACGVFLEANYTVRP